MNDDNNSKANKPLTEEQIKELWNKYGIDPDNELLRWERWVRIRKEETAHLSKLINRPPVDLVMNHVEDYRENREYKLVLEHAQLEKKNSLWELVPRLAQRDYDDPVYEAHRTRIELGVPPIIEHISVPYEIKRKEKCLTGNPGRKTDYEHEHLRKYRQKRAADLAERIKIIDPVNPDMKDLMIQGKGYNKPKSPVIQLPLLSVSQYNTIHETTTGIYALRINNTLIIKDIPGQNVKHLESLKKKYLSDSCTTWSYYFNVPVNKVGRNKMYIENYGTVTLRYSWKRIRHPIPYIPDNMSECVFFFNKNEDVLPPGQSREIYFTFVSNMPGIFEERWEFSTCNVFLFNNHVEKLSVHLYSDCTEDLKAIQGKFKAVQEHISKTNIEYFIRDILFDPVEKAPIVEPLIYPYNKMLSEAEMFIMKNPVCYYHQSEVENLKDMYMEYEDTSDWNLSIATWRERMIKEPFEERMRLYEILKESFSTMLRPWYEEGDLLADKYRAVKMILGMLADNIEKEYFRLESAYTLRLSIESEESKISIETVRIQNINITINSMLRMYTHVHVKNALEQIAGVISSIDLNRHIKFDFCK